VSTSLTTLDPGVLATREELSLALTELRERAGLTVRDVAKRIDVPVATVGGWFSGQHVPPVAATSQVRALLRTCGVADAELDHWLEAVARVRRRPGRRPGTAPAPYRGLAPFQPEDAPWFFGREELVAHLVEVVTQRPETPIAVVGPSGAGKSSLLRAGLIPELCAGHTAGGEPEPADRPLVALLTPGAHPTEALDGALGGSPVRAVVVDQAEEIFTACTDVADRQEFLRRLAGLAAAGTPVVLGLRADFYASALREPDLLPALRQHQVVVGAMTTAELRRALVEPARRAGLEVEDALFDVVLTDLAPGHGATTSYDAGALPLFAHALYETWERGSRRRLTVADYRAAGGIQGAIATTAERVHGALGPEDQERARRLFLRLVHVGEDVADTRRRVEPDVLLETPGDAELLERFVDARLVIVDEDVVQLAHEALIQAWPRLRQWIDSDRAGLLLHRELAEAAAAWQRADRDPGLLLRSGRLAATLEWAVDPARSLNQLERAFLAASTTAAESERAAEVRRTRRLRALVAALSALVLVVTGVSGYAFTLRAQAAAERDLALSRQLAEAANRVRATEPGIASQFALLAYRTAETAEARSALLDSSALPLPHRVAGPGGLPYLAVSGDSRLLASAGDAGGLRLWTVSGDAEPVLTEAATLPDVDGEALYAVATNRDGTLVAAGGVGTVVHVWDTSDPQDPRLVADLGGPSWTVMGLAFSPDGRTLAAASADSFLYLWDVATLTPLGEPLGGAAGQLQSVTFSPDGTVVAAGCSDMLVHRWHLTDRALPAQALPDLAGPTGAIGSVAFSPDGTTLVAGSKDAGTYTWEIGSPTGAAGEPAVGQDAGSWVNAVAWSADGATLVAGGSDRKVRLYEAESNALLSEIPHPGPVTGAAFLPDGRGLVTAASDGVVRLWPSPTPGAPVPGGRVFAVALGDDGRLYAAGSATGIARAFDVTDRHRPRALAPGVTAPEGARLDGTLALAPDGATVATGTTDGRVWLWDATAAPLRLIAAAPQVQQDLIEALAWSPDGGLLAAASDDSTVQLWDVRDPAGAAALGRIEPGGGMAMTVAFSPDGRTLAVGHSTPHMLTLWDVTDPASPRMHGEPVTGPAQHVTTVAFSPDGTTLAVGSADRTMRLLDVSAPGSPAWIGDPIVGAAGIPYFSAFSPDGDTLGTAVADGTLRLWDVADRARPHALAVLAGDSAALYSVAFAPSGDRIAAGGVGATVRLWDLDPEQVADRVCALAGMGVSPEEWRRYLPSVPYRDACSQP